jgi:salicylate hydroxylase
MPSPTSITVIGGGIGGLTAALAFARRGLDVAVYEQSSTLKEVGAGVQIGPNGTRVLHALGLKDALDRSAVIPARRELRHWKSGETWNWFDLGASSIERYGSPHILMHRGDLHGILADALVRLRPNAIRLDRKCIGVSETEDRIEARFAGGETAVSDFLVGADGIHSRVRECLFGADAPQFTGCVAWRGLVAMERLPPHLARMHATNWLGPHGHVLHYPVRRGELMNFISFVERDDWQVESWTVAGTTTELAGDFPGWHPDVHAFIELIETPFKWALMARPAMERWSRGRITLLGDACHPTLPFLGQGAVMAIEDGYVLAACLQKLGADPPAALARYEEIRRERTAMVVRKSHENRRHAFSPAMANANEAAASIARDWQQARVKERLDWLYAYDATAAEI